MAREVTVDIDHFASGIAELLGDIPEACGDALTKSVQQSVRKTAKGLRGGEFGSAGKHEWSDRYMSGFQSHVEKGNGTAQGEVGNAHKPGLVHLLEKGHLTPAGRRTNAYPHMDPAFQSMAEDFVERAKKNVGEALD